MLPRPLLRRYLQSEAIVMDRERDAASVDTEKIIAEIKSRPAQNIKCERILVPTDGSGQAFRAIGEAITLARATGAELTILMTVDYDKNVAAFERVSLSGYVPAELKIAAFQYLAEVMHSIPAEIRAHTRVEVGDPGEQIVAVATEEESDLICMGSRGFGAFHSLLVGSVSSHVMKYAPCPVLLCKGMPDDWDDE